MQTRRMFRAKSQVPPQKVRCDKCAKQVTDTTAAKINTDHVNAKNFSRTTGRMSYVEDHQQWIKRRSLHGTSGACENGGGTKISPSLSYWIWSGYSIKNQSMKWYLRDIMTTTLASLSKGGQIEWNRRRTKMEPLSREREKIHMNKTFKKTRTQEWHTNLYEIGEFGSGNSGFLFGVVSPKPVVSSKLVTEVDTTSADNIWVRNVS